ncbi:MAG: beta strand repeat-containing protein [Balneola sp.]
MNKNKAQNTRSKASRFAWLFLVFGVLLSITSVDVFAQVPPANTPIGNQASATYVDNGGNPQSVTSNTVETIVQQVAGVTITAGINLTVSPGGQVTFPHTITNTGNGIDSFDLTTLEGSGDFNFDNIVIYADEDGNGVPDNFTPITTTPNISFPGNTGGNPNTYGIVIVADIPVTANDGDVETFQVTATSNYDSNESASGTNTTTVDEDAVVNVQKNRSVQNVAVGDTVTYTFSYAESGGNSNATNLVIKDPLPAGVTYVPGSGIWSGASGIPLTDVNTGETAAGITYEYDDTGVADSVIIQIASINAGASGTISFKVTVNSGTEGNTILNTGSYFHNDAPTPTTTNPADIIVDENYDIESIGTDTVSVAEVDQGAIVNFVNKFVNVGTATDTYTITTTNDNYPSGTTFTFYQADANDQPTSPFTQGGGGQYVTGPVAVGDTIVVILQVNLPSGVSGGPYSVVKTLTSVNDPAESDFHVDKLEGIKEPTVDITNGGGINTGTGVGQGPETNPVTTITTNPNTTVNFSLVVTNTSAVNDNYALNFGIDTTAAGALSNPGVLPTGWTASFRDPNNSNTVITQTGTIASGDSMQVTFRVNIPAGYAPGDVELYVRALSQTTGAVDIKHERVSVNTVRNLSLTANQTGQVSPGGSVNYIHTLTVNSNVTENDGTNTNFHLDLTNSVPTGWTAVVYWDTDEDGLVTSVDSLLTSAATPGTVDLPPSVGTLAFGDQLKFIVNVNASTGLSDGATVTTTITISDVGLVGLASISNNDQTEVQAGVISIDKFQAPDVSGSAGTYTKNQFNVFPGDTVWYKIVVVNDGSEPVTNVVIQDNVPSYTTIAVAATVTQDIGTIAGLALDGANPTAGNTGTVKVTATSLQPTHQFTIVFAVKVDE